MNSISNAVAPAETAVISKKSRKENHSEIPQDFLAAMLENMNCSEQSTVSDIIAADDTAVSVRTEDITENVMMFNNPFMASSFVSANSNLNNLSDEIFNAALSIENVQKQNPETEIDVITADIQTDDTIADGVAMNETVIENIPADTDAEESLTMDDTVIANISVDTDAEESLTMDDTITENISVNDVTAETFPMDDTIIESIPMDEAEAETENIPVDNTVTENSFVTKNIPLDNVMLGSIPLSNTETEKIPEDVSEPVKDETKDAEKTNSVSKNSPEKIYSHTEKEISVQQIQMTEHTVVDSSVQMASQISEHHFNSAANVNIAVQSNIENIAQLSDEVHIHSVASDGLLSGGNSDIVADLSSVEVITKIDENQDTNNQNFNNNFSSNNENNGNNPQNANPLIQEHKLQSDFYKGVTEVKKFMDSMSNEVSSEKTDTANLEKESVTLDINEMQMAFNNTIKGTDINPVESGMEDIYKPAEIMKQTMDGISYSVNKGEEKFVIRLNPEGLGEITVTILKNDSSSILSLSASNSKTAEILSSDIASLQESLKHLNIEIADIQVHEPEQSSQYNSYEEQYEKHNNRNRHNEKNNNDEIFDDDNADDDEKSISDI